jgi:hypothetical protein
MPSDPYPAHPAELEAQRLFARVLSQWTMDTLRLRAIGLDVPTPHPGDGGITLPALPSGPGPSAYAVPRRWSQVQTHRALSWRPAVARRKAA